MRKLRIQSKRSLMGVALSMLAAIAVLAATLLSTAQARPSSPKTIHASAFMAGGTPIALTATASARLSGANITQSYLLSSHAGRSYYRFVKQDGTLCYGASSNDNPNPPGMVICLNSDTVPAVVDFSVYQQLAGDSGFSVWRLEGLVNSASVTRVAVLAPDGHQVASVPVVNDVYYQQFASPIPAGTVERLDATGKVVGTTALPSGAPQAPVAPQTP